MTKPFASLCILSWTRPDMLLRCLSSLHQTLDYPAEIIVNFDGGYVLPDGVDTSLVSKLILVNGGNRGVGRSLQNCLGMSEGTYVFKIDDDLVFEPHWLSTAVAMLDNNPDVGAISLFDYNHYDPADTRFQHLLERKDCYIVTDFVSSVVGFRAEDIPLLGTIPDDGIHTRLAKEGNRVLAIPKTDVVKNTGFGRNSVYLQFDEAGNASKRPTTATPQIFPLT